MHADAKMYHNRTPSPPLSCGKIILDIARHIRAVRFTRSRQPKMLFMTLVIFSSPLSSAAASRLTTGLVLSLTSR